MPKDYDPRIHSAEHILNQTMDRMFGCGRSVSAHIEREKSRCYYRFDRPLSQEEVSRIEQQVNEAIGKDLVVSEQFMDREEVAQWFDLNRVPEEAGDRLRIIMIGDYDRCPCIGHHVKRTSEIGTFQIYSHSFGEGILKLRFRLRNPSTDLRPPFDDSPTP